MTGESQPLFNVMLSVRPLGRDAYSTYVLASRPNVYIVMQRNRVADMPVRSWQAVGMSSRYKEGQ